MPVTAPADRRFLRAHQVKPGRRQSPWRARLRAVRTTLVVLAVVALTGRGAFLVTHAETLQVSHLVISGNRQLATEEVERLLSGLRGQNVLTVNLDLWRARLLGCPWVGDATLRRSLPSTIEVLIVERRPMAIGRRGDQLFLVDERGAAIDRYGPQYAEIDLPLLDGLRVSDQAPSGADERRAALAARLLREVEKRPDVARRISQLDVSDPHNAVVIVDKDTARVRLGDDQFLQRLQVYLDLAPRLREQVPEIDYVDLRFGERVYVGPQAAAATAAPVPAGRPTNQ